MISSWKNNNKKVHSLMHNHRRNPLSPIHRSNQAMAVTTMNPMMRKTMGLKMSQLLIRPIPNKMMQRWAASTTDWLLQSEILTS